MATIKMPVLVRDGRYFIDVETIMQLVSDVDPVLTVILDRYIKQWCYEKVVPVRDGEGAYDPDCPYCGSLWSG